MTVRGQHSRFHSAAIGTPTFCIPFPFISGNRCTPSVSCLWRADSVSAGRNALSSGLGMNISKALAAFLGATISCETAPGQGTTMSLRLRVLWSEDQAPSEPRHASRHRRSFMLRSSSNSKPRRASQSSRQSSGLERSCFSSPQKTVDSSTLPAAAEVSDAQFAQSVAYAASSRHPLGGLDLQLAQRRSTDSSGLLQQGGSQRWDSMPALYRMSDSGEIRKPSALGRLAASGVRFRRRHTTADRCATTHASRWCRGACPFSSQSASGRRALTLATSLIASPLRAARIWIRRTRMRNRSPLSSEASGPAKSQPQSLRSTPLL